MKNKILLILLIFDFYCYAESPNNLIIIPEQYNVIADTYLGTQYFIDYRYDLSTYDIYNALITDFPDSIIQIVNFHSFEIYPDKIPIIFSEEIRKRIIYTPIEIAEGYFVTPSLEEMINNNFLVSMCSNNYQVIIQCFIVREKISDNYYEQVLSLSLAYYSNSANINDSENELTEFMRSIKYYFINNFSENFQEENFIENEEIFFKRFQKDKY